jgi:hypothetical protein
MNFILKCPTKLLLCGGRGWSKSAANESDNKCSELAGKLSEAEKALQRRDIHVELRQLRNEVNKSLVDSSTAQKSAIDIEKQL